MYFIGTLDTMETVKEKYKPLDCNGQCSEQQTVQYYNLTIWQYHEQQSSSLHLWAVKQTAISAELLFWAVQQTALCTALLDSTANSCFGRAKELFS